jgi:hypothetical protein
LLEAVLAIDPLVPMGPEPPADIPHGRVHLNEDDDGDRFIPLIDDDYGYQMALDLEPPAPFQNMDLDFPAPRLRDLAELPPQWPFDEQVELGAAERIAIEQPQVPVGDHMDLDEPVHEANVRQQAQDPLVPQTWIMEDGRGMPTKGRVFLSVYHNYHHVVFDVDIVAHRRVLPGSIWLGFRNRMMQLFVAGLALPIMFPRHGRVEEATAFLVAPAGHVPPLGWQPPDFPRLSRFGDAYRLLGSIRNRCQFGPFLWRDMYRHCSKSRDYFERSLRLFIEVGLVVREGLGYKLVNAEDSFTLLIHLLQLI